MSSGNAAWDAWDDDDSGDKEEWDSWEQNGGSPLDPSTSTKYEDHAQEWAPTSDYVLPQTVMGSITAMLCPVLAVSLGYACYSRRQTAAFCIAGYLYANVFFLTLCCLKPSAAFSKSQPGMLAHLSVLHYYGLFAICLLLPTSAALSWCRLVMAPSGSNFVCVVFATTTLVSIYTTLLPYTRKLISSIEKSADPVQIQVNSQSCLQRLLVYVVEFFLEISSCVRHAFSFIYGELQHTKPIETYENIAHNYPMCLKVGLCFLFIGWLTLVWLIAMSRHCHHSNSVAQITCNLVCIILELLGGASD